MSSAVSRLLVITTSELQRETVWTLIWVHIVFLYGERGTRIKGQSWPPLEPKTKNASPISFDMFNRRIS